MVASAIEGERSDFSVAVLLSNSSITAKKIREVLPKKLRLITLTSSAKVRENLTELGLDVEILEDSLSSQGLSVLNNLHDIVLQGLGEGRFNSSDRILAIMANLFEAREFASITTIPFIGSAIIANEHGVDIEVLARVMELARQIGGRGREGHAVGALFAIGSVPKLRRYTTAIVLNPFKGHSDSKKDVTVQNNHETLAEFAWLDGAILFNSKGIASDAGRYVQVPSGINPKSGEGGRHLAARAISQLADAIAICVSSSGVITLYSKGRERYRVRLS